ncbi:uncharacterized protein LOC120171164 [Hibiscus syriacus]|uniref:uncharacterized protein LOC120171164 n=1 Tax=Hibiscus syriacus TaxID=106335 RepID=UPI0019226D2E|nr:uncharacterized protein LOC120171164 [Hibiscus syriacus]
MNSSIKCFHINAKVRASDKMVKEDQRRHRRRCWLLCLIEELRNIERQVYDMETSYLQDPSQCGHVLKSFEGFLSSPKNTALLKRSRKFQLEDRLFSLSSAISPAAEEVAVRACSMQGVSTNFLFNVLLFVVTLCLADGKSYCCGAGRSKGGGYFANGQGKPKKGRTREAKRQRHSSEPDFDDDDPDVTF